MNYALFTISSIHILFSMEKFEDFSSVTPPLAYHHVIYDLSFFRVKKMLMFKLKYFGYFSFDFNCNFFHKNVYFFFHPNRPNLMKILTLGTNYGNASCYHLIFLKFSFLKLFEISIKILKKAQFYL